MWGLRAARRHDRHRPRALLAARPHRPAVACGRPVAGAAGGLAGRLTVQSNRDAERPTCGCAVPAWRCRAHPTRCCRRRRRCPPTRSSSTSRTPSRRSRRSPRGPDRVRRCNTHDYSGKTRVVRVNGVTTQWCLGDITEVVAGAGAHLDCVMVPKVRGRRAAALRRPPADASSRRARDRAPHRHRGADRERAAAR